MVEEKLVYEPADEEFHEFRNKFFTSPYHKTNYVKCKGCYFHEYFENFGDRIGQMDVRDDDIWLCAFPKTGIRQCMTTEKFYMELRKVLFSTIILWIQSNTSIIYHPLDLSNHICLFTYYLKNFKVTPLQPKNPKDTCVSAYHYCKSFHGYTGSLEQIADVFLKEKILYGSFSDHIRGYVQQRSKPNILFLRYEEMKKDLKLAIHKTASFIGKSLTEKEVEELLDHLSFSSMKQNKAVNYDKRRHFMKKYGKVGDDGTFIRCGETGQWKEVMSSNLCERFEKWEEENLKDIDFSV